MKKPTIAIGHNQVAVITIEYSMGLPGVGVPTGGTTNQVLAKINNADYETKWIDQDGGEDNVIVAIKRNGNVLPIESKTVNVIVPTKTTELENDSSFITVAVVNEKIEDHNASEEAHSALFTAKQDVLKAGSGINIQDNIISSDFTSIDKAIKDEADNRKKADTALDSKIKENTDTIAKKITNPQVGSPGQVLKKTDTGEEWANDGGVNLIDAITLNGVDVPPVDKVVKLVVNKDTVGLSEVDNTSDEDKPISNAVNTQLNNKPNNSQLGRSTQGASKGIATLDESGTITFSQIPEKITSKVDQSQIGKETVGEIQGVCPLASDGKINPIYLRGEQSEFISFPTKADFPAVGDEYNLYVAIDTNLTYRWNGNGYSDLDASLAIGVTPGTAFDGKRGKDLEIEMPLKASDEALQSEINARKYAVKDLKETKVNISSINKPTTDGQIGIAGLDKQGKSPTNQTIVGQIDDFNFNPLYDVQFQNLSVGQTMQISSRTGSVSVNTPPFINPNNTTWNGSISRNGSQGYTIII